MEIVAPVDKSERARLVVEEAAALSQAFDAKLHVVHVMSRSEFVELGTRRAESDDPIDVAEVRETAADIAAEAAASIEYPHEVVGLVGEPAEEVVSYATERDAGYIVVSGRRRSPAGKALFGSVAQSILLNADCPVVSTVRQREE